jgi:hypothetical protein
MKRSRPRWRPSRAGPAAADTNAGRKTKPVRFKFLAERAGLSASGTWAAGQSRAVSYYAIDHDLTLKEAALAKGVPEDLYDKVVIPLNLTRPGTADVSS